jgi:hypothetical protein
MLHDGAREAAVRVDGWVNGRPFAVERAVKVRDRRGLDGWMEGQRARVLKVSGI